MLTHVVLFTLVDPATRGQVKARLEALTAAIPSLDSLQVGLDEGGSDAAADLVLITTHADAAGLAEYQVHPAHQEFVSWVTPLLAARAIVDFTS